MQIRFMGIFRINTSVPWLTNTDGELNIFATFILLDNY